MAHGQKAKESAADKLNAGEGAGEQTTEGGACEQAPRDAAAGAQNQKGSTADKGISSSWWVYMILCKDGSYYTGIATDVERRFEEHRSQGEKAARYTRTHPVQELVAHWPAADRAEASRWEYRIKKLSHDEKTRLAAHPDTLLTATGLSGESE